MLPKGSMIYSKAAEKSAPQPLIQRCGTPSHPVGKVDILKPGLKAFLVVDDWETPTTLWCFVFF